MPRDLVLLSGGLDSATLLAWHAESAALAVSVDYGQRHCRELAAAKDIAAYYGVAHEVVDLSGWGRLLGGSSLTDPQVAVPHGHYTDESMRATVVPNRNATLLMAAAGIAVACDCSRVLTAVHAGDHPIYADCRPDFIDSAARTADLGTDGAVTIEAPFSLLTKTDIARLATELEVPLGLTWSCYEGDQEHCGRCGTCTERREALSGAGVPDPTVYRAVPA